MLAGPAHGDQLLSALEHFHRSLCLSEPPRPPGGDRVETGGQRRGRGSCVSALCSSGGGGNLGWPPGCTKIENGLSEKQESRMELPGGGDLAGRP